MATSGTVSGDSTLLFQARADSSSQTGQLLSQAIDRKTGALLEVRWDASEKLPAPEHRQIVTVNTDETPVAFRWASLDASRKAQLDDNVSLLDFLRGDASNEGSRFRVRQDATGTNRLGDIISSAPVYVGAPAFRYRHDLESIAYSKFADAHRDRKGMIYVGANDGMLHAFDAATGVEAFAYVPGSLFPQLPGLSTKATGHRTYVDGSASVGDVFFNGAWRTVLVGGLNGGGRGIYALDVTEPSAFVTAESQPRKLVLWEFTDAHDPDLGLTYSQPVIGRLRDGTWVAIFGNGYRNRSTDGVASKTGNAVLYIVDIANGNILRKLDTGGAGNAAPPAGVTWQNGLSTPAAVDTDGDRVIDYVYAGDLYGNLWKFDLTSARRADWNIALSAQPVFQARSADSQVQPIIARPEVGRGPNGIGVVVLFGAGNDPEATGTPTLTANHTFYGVLDRHQGAVPGRHSLQAQQVSYELPLKPGDAATQVRVVTAKTGELAAGWYLDMQPPPGQRHNGQYERMASNPAVRDSKVIFRTQVMGSQPCEPVLTWTMALNLLSGGSSLDPDHPFFDITGDGLFNAADGLVTTPQGARRFAISGVASYSPMSRALMPPTVIEGETIAGLCAHHIYSPEYRAGRHLAASCSAGGTGRQSWRQLR